MYVVTQNARQNVGNRIILIMFLCAVLKGEVFIWLD